VLCTLSIYPGLLVSLSCILVMVTMLMMIDAAIAARMIVLSESMLKM
jgi:hypothetical protein